MVCRVCATPTTHWLNLGVQPLANGFYTETPPPKYPLSVERCPSCFLSQLTVTVPPAILYENYTYRSGLSHEFSKYCGDITVAGAVWTRNPQLGGKHPVNARWLDIASNDGTLLRHAVYTGFAAQGIEPAAGLAAVANAEGLSTTVGFFPDVTKDWEPAQFGIISSLNVLGHVADVHAFAAEVERLLTPTGSWVVSVPWVLDLVKGGEFDTIYHEHLSYWSLRALDTLARAHGMKVTYANWYPIHGGSLLVRIRRQNPARDFVMWNEDALADPLTYADFRKQMETRVNKVRNALSSLHGRWAGYGAAAKGTVFAHVAGLNANHLAFVVDETPEKQGKKTPYGVPVVPLAEDTFDGISNVLVFPWNVLDEIKVKVPKGIRVVSTK